MARPEKVRLGEILVQQKLLTPEQLKLALDEQKRSGRKLGRVFIEQGYVTEEEISEALAKQLQIPYINLKYYNIKPEVVQKLPETQARRFRAIVLEDNLAGCDDGGWNLFLFSAFEYGGLTFCGYRFDGGGASGADRGECDCG